MKFVFHTNSLSPHQLPLARKLVELFGQDNYRYVYTTPQTMERSALGWPEVSERWVVHEDSSSQGLGSELDGCDVLMSSLREFARFEKRASNKLRSIYVSERWLKPIRCLGVGRFSFSLPGVFRLFVPSYFRMARRMVRLLQDDVGFSYFAIGVLAAEDIVRVSRVCGIRFFSPASWLQALGGLLFSPRIKMERTPGGEVWTLNGILCRNIRLWGYFVAPTTEERKSTSSPKDALKVLWAGRMIPLKRVDSLVEAVRIVAARSSPEAIRLTLVGAGSEESRLRRQAEGLEVEFIAPMDVRKIRAVMRQNDVFVFPSNAYEGWGAVVSEALEEGMQVFGSRDAGAALTLLPEGNLFDPGDARALATLLENERIRPLPRTEAREWSVGSAAQALSRILGGGGDI